MMGGDNGSFESYSSFSNRFIFSTSPCTPYYVSESKFKANSLWYKPYTTEKILSRTWQPWPASFYTYSEEKAEYSEVNFHDFKRVTTPSKDIKKMERIGFLTITYLRFGKQNIKKVPVLYEERNCSKNQE